MPHSNIKPPTRDRARKLRREMTKAEAAMWDMLRDLRPYGARFRRETPIGPYIADFAWLSVKLVIEVDGDSHETTKGRAHDFVRNAFLQSQGFKVLRFDNDQVLDGPDHVFLTIEQQVRPFLKRQLGSEYDEKPQSDNVSKALADGIESVLQLRLELLKAGNVAEAERLRVQLAGKGVRLRDSRDSVSGELTTDWEIGR